MYLESHRQVGVEMSITKEYVFQNNRYTSNTIQREYQKSKISHHGYSSTNDYVVMMTKQWIKNMSNQMKTWWVETGCLIRYLFEIPFEKKSLLKEIEKVCVSSFQKLLLAHPIYVCERFFSISILFSVS